jgi:transcriptional regulator with PAS, ATPase and Fis domain
VTDEVTTRGADLDALHTLEVRGATVIVVEGPDAPVRLRTEGGSVLVGSGNGCDLRLSDPLVSRQHIEIRCERTGVHVTDRGSRNGTFFEGSRVMEMLVSGAAELTLGSTRIRIEIDRDALHLPFSRRTTFGTAFAHSEKMRHVFQVLEVAAKQDVTILLEGESGTGKEMLATSVHAESARRDGPFVVVDCGSIAPNLVESELFGHERGAFTGAAATRIGAFEQANGGTIFLDEIGELPLEAQPKLLRALETRSFRRVGGTKTISVEVRVVAATNRRLREAVRCKEFREDLFYRLAVVHLVVPRLADRPDDIVPLAERFLRAATRNRHATVAPELARILTAYHWPGNARELRNVIDRFVTFRDPDPSVLFESAPGQTGGRATTIDVETLAHLSYAEAKRGLLEVYHRNVLPRVIAESGNSVAKAAETLGMSRTNLYRLLQEMGAGVEDE